MRPVVCVKVDASMEVRLTIHILSGRRKLWMTGTIGEGPCTIKDTGVLM